MVAVELTMRDKPSTHNITRREVNTSHTHLTLREKQTAMQCSGFMRRLYLTGFSQNARKLR
ncbi:hypothetical protein E2C01_080183 [Portunus trituberculatus]|uniref:Uncharacterized protein n=1 Tax=Portunus trituberculatus TaxID=210409 RepID=A0A5B7IIX8_PORTR|nr:hypothetical protein [Portunus trituberculatus]